MKILLTGANGYIGVRLLPILVQEGHDVVCLVRDRRRMRIDEAVVERVTFYEADLLHAETLQDLPSDIDVAFLLGALYGQVEQL